MSQAVRQIYFIRRLDTGLIKIGCSRWPAERRYSLQCSKKAPMHLLAQAPARGYGYSAERAVHRAFAEARVESEWFQPTDALLQLIEIVKQTGEIPAAVLGGREDDFARRYLAGATLQEIATDHGITRERVRQILRANGVPSLGQRPLWLTRRLRAEGRTA